jgi:hypothetical protein
MLGRHARVHRNVPRRLTAIMRSHSSTGIASMATRDMGTRRKSAALFHQDGDLTEGLGSGSTHGLNALSVWIATRNRPVNGQIAIEL